MRDDGFEEIEFKGGLLILTRQEFKKALRRGRITLKNRRAAEDRRQTTQARGVRLAV
jgi:hypothetical protein